MNRDELRVVVANAVERKALDLPDELTLDRLVEFVWETYLAIYGQHARPSPSTHSELRTELTRLFESAMASAPNDAPAPYIEPVSPEGLHCAFMIWPKDLPPRSMDVVIRNLEADALFGRVLGSKWREAGAGHDRFPVLSTLTDVVVTVRLTPERADDLLEELEEACRMIQRDNPAALAALWKLIAVARIASGSGSWVDAFCN